MKKGLLSTIFLLSMFLVLGKLSAEGLNAPWEGRDISDPSCVMWHALDSYCPPEEKSLVVIITVFNAKKWYKVVLDSVFAQKYKNYRVIIVFDKPTDGCEELMIRYVKRKKQEHRVTFIRNTEWKSQLANHYTAGHMCDDHEIMINLDCDDCFAHEYVLTLINKVYNAYPHIYCTYGGSEYWPKDFATNCNTPIPAQVIEEGNFRYAHHADLFRWAWWHPRTFYAWVFKQVKLQDLLHESSFKPLGPSPDSAFMYPIFEMLSTKNAAECHFMHIPDILYIWNMKNPLSQWCSSGGKQFIINRLIASWEPYEQLKNPAIGRMGQFKDNKADLVIWSEDPNQLEILLNSLIMHVMNSGHMYVFYPVNAAELTSKYGVLQETFPQVHFVQLTNENGKQTFEQALNNLSQQHVLLLTDTVEIQKSIDCTYCIQELERTFAHGFYLGLSQQEISSDDIPEYAPVTDTLGAWQFKFAQNRGARAYDCNLVLYRKAEMLSWLADQSYNTLTELKNCWLGFNEQPDRIGRKVGLFLR
ncbi:MAG: glycosyltransferase [Candidatus Babeliaceae bacterium]